MARPFIYTPAVDVEEKQEPLDVVASPQPNRLFQRPTKQFNAPFRYASALERGETQQIQADAPEPLAPPIPVPSLSLPPAAAPPPPTPLLSSRALPADDAPVPQPQSIPIDESTLSSIAPSLPDVQPPAPKPAPAKVTAPPSPPPEPKADALTKQFRTGTQAAAVAASKAMPSSRQIVVDLAAHQVKLVEAGKVLRTYPAAVGTASTPTPTGEFRAIDLDPNPESEGGVLGPRWIGFLRHPGLYGAYGQFGIHGNNDPSSIGKDASHGCVRLKNDDIKELYGMISPGMPIRVEGHSPQLPIPPHPAPPKPPLPKGLQIDQPSTRR